MSKLRPAGQLLLLLVFILQWKFLTQADAEQSKFDNAPRDYAMARLAGESALTRYFVTREDVFLKQSATETANALSLILLSTYGSAETGIRLIRDLKTKANAIHALGDYNAFIQLVNETGATTKEQWKARGREIDKHRSRAWLACFLFSIVGLALTWVGETFPVSGPTVRKRK